MKKSLGIAVMIIYLIGIWKSARLIAEDAEAKEAGMGAAVSAYYHGEFTAALKAYKRRAQSGGIDGYLNLAVILKDLGDYGKAIYILKEAGARFGSDVRILSLLGRIYYFNGQKDEAIAVLKNVLEISPDDLDAWVTLGLCFEEKGDDANAKRHYDKAVALDKNNITARLSLASLYYRKGNIPEAVNEYTFISAFDASIISAQKILGEMYYRMNELEEALKRYRKIKLLDPKDTLALKRIEEISARIGQEYFAKERERLALGRKKKKVTIEPRAPIKGVVNVRVGLMQGENALSFKCSSAFEVKTKSKGLLVFNGKEDENYHIAKKSESELVFTCPGNEPIAAFEAVIITPLKPQGAITLFNVAFGKNNFWSGRDDRSYRGMLEVGIRDSGINAVNVISLEEYLYSVLASEMPAHWPKEALKAQAIAARAEAMKKLGRHKDAGFDLCPEVHCQAYAGIERETEFTTKAVDETRGVVMVYQGKPIDALYSSSCGGHTQGNIFGDTKDIPYLKGVPDTLARKDDASLLSPLELEYRLKGSAKDVLCDTADNSRWVRIYPAEELEQMLSQTTDIGKIKKILVLKRNASGHISRIKIIGDKASYSLEKELNIRNALGNLRSSLFKVEVKYGQDGKPQVFIFYGRGWGHGVGMCQSGAYSMANTGYGYKEILSHYFQEIEFKKAY